MKRLSQIILVILGLAAVGFAGLFAYSHWEYRKREVTLPAPTQQPLSEKQAIAVSREALHKLGEEVTRFTPLTYDGGNLYARNTLNPLSGYVLWASSDSHPGFVVHLEQTGEVIHCGVSRCK